MFPSKPVQTLTLAPKQTAQSARLIVIWAAWITLSGNVAFVIDAVVP
jgi:hypothetical protein